MTTWILPFVILDMQIYFPIILLIGAVYGVWKKISSVSEFFRDIALALVIAGFGLYGSRSGHSFVGLLGAIATCLLCIVVFSKEYAKVNDMAPYGHLTAFCVLNTLLIFGGLLTSELY